MKIARLFDNWGRVAAATGAATLLIAWCGGASAQLPPPPRPFTVDENCNGTVSSVFGTVPLPCAFLPDPGPGGLPSVMTYDLAEPSEVAGDLLLTDGAAVFDVIRFNPTQGGGSLVFYSDNVPGFDALADTPSAPFALYTNVLRIPELGPEGNNGAIYTPTAGQPGFVAGIIASYDIHSDSVPVPEPATLALLGIGLAGLGFSRRRKLN